MTNYHLSAVQTKRYFRIHIQTYLMTVGSTDVIRRPLTKCQKEKKKSWNHWSRFTTRKVHCPESAVQFSCFKGLQVSDVWACQSFWQALAYVPGRIVWNICRIPWTSVRWGGMSLMYVSRRAPLEVTSTLCCVLWMKNMTNISLCIHHT